MFSRKKFLLWVVALLVIVTFTIEVVFSPRVRVRVERTLVGPDNEVIKMLSRPSSLEEIKKAIEQSGQHVDDISWRGGSLLYHAARKQRIDVAEWLLSSGANPNGIDPAMTPLETAIARNDASMVRLLVKSGTDPDLRLPDGMTARFTAEVLGDPEVMAALLSAEAEATAEADKADEPASAGNTDL